MSKRSAAANSTLDENARTRAKTDHSHSESHFPNRHCTDGADVSVRSSSSASSVASNGVCHECGSIEHFVSRCPIRRAKQRNNHAPQAEPLQIERERNSIAHHRGTLAASYDRADANAGSDPITDHSVSSSSPTSNACHECGLSDHFASRCPIRRARQHGHTHAGAVQPTASSPAVSLPPEKRNHHTPQTEAQEIEQVDHATHTKATHAPASYDHYDANSHNRISSAHSSSSSSSITTSSFLSSYTSCVCHGCCSTDHLVSNCPIQCMEKRNTNNATPAHVSERVSLIAHQLGALSLDELTSITTIVASLIQKARRSRDHAAAEERKTRDSERSERRDARQRVPARSTGVASAVTAAPASDSDLSSVSRSLPARYTLLSYGSIPLDCLAVVCSFLGEVHEHVAIHSTNRHYRIIRTAAYRYTHAYASVGYVLPIRWNRESESCAYDGVYHHLHSKSKSIPHPPRPLSELILSGLKSSFRYLHSLSISFHVDEGRFCAPRGPALSAIRSVRVRFSALLSTFRSLKHLAIVDFIYFIWNKSETVLAIDQLAAAMSQISTLRTFHYDLQGGSLGTPHRIISTIPDALVSALAKCRHLRVIGGRVLVVALSQAQWMRLFSECAQLTSIGDVWYQQCVMLHRIYMNPISSCSLDPSHARAVQQIRSFRYLSNASGFAAQFAEMGCTQLSEYHITNVDVTPSSAPLLSSLFRSLVRLSLDAVCIPALSEIRGLPQSLHQLLEFELLNPSDRDYESDPITPRWDLLVSFVIQLPQLRSLILRHAVSPLRGVHLAGILTGCRSLIHLSWSEVYPDHYLASMKHIESSHSQHPNLRLLHVAYSEYRNDQFRLADSMSVCNRMIRAAERVSWMDVLTLDPMVLTARIDGEHLLQPDYIMDSMTSRSRRTLSYEEMARDYSACSWKKKYEKIDRMTSLEHTLLISTRKESGV